MCLLGLSLNAIASWWWADPLAAYVLVVYGGREAWTIARGDH
jgi:divalent metal cation (Fe/Co/Zn/Cd) transporter